MQTRSSFPQGFTIVEVLVALVVIVLVLGGLEGATAGTLRKLQDSDNESLAAQLVQTRAEWLLAGPCTPSGGTDSTNRVATTWLATTDGQLVRVAQTVRYPTAFGIHTEAYQTMGWCQ